MNRKLQFLGVFLAGIVLAMVYNYFYNMNSRYIPMRTQYGNVNISILDTRTGEIYLDVEDDKKHRADVLDLVEAAKISKKKKVK